MALVHFYTYFCRCGEFLFNNSDITNTSTFLKRNYIMVEKSLNLNIYISGSNIVKCSTCNSALGGAIYRRFQGKSDLIRFAGHLIERKKVYLAVHRVQDATNYCVKVIYGKPMSRHYHW